MARRWVTVEWCDLDHLLARIEPWKSYVRCHGDTAFCPWNFRWRDLWISRLWCSWRGHRWDYTTDWGWRMCGRCRYDEMEHDDA